MLHETEVPVARFSGMASLCVERSITTNRDALAQAHGTKTYQIVYVECGSGRVSAGNQTVRLSDGDVYFYDASALRCDEDVTGSRIWHLSIESNAALFPLVESYRGASREPNLHQVHVPQEDRAHWNLRWRYLLSVLNRSCTTRDLVQSLVRSVLFDLIQLEQTCRQVDKDTHRRIAAKVLKYIDAGYSRPITLSGVAREMGLSPAYLTDLVRRETGFPIHRWVIKRRILAAQRLLSETDYTIAAVASQVGFHDACSLCRQFQKVTGFTPKAWRALFRPQSPLLPTFQHPDGRLPLPRPLGENIMDMQPAMMAVRDPSGSFVYMNRRWTDYTGMGFEESRGWNWLGIVHPDDAAACVAAWQSVKKSGASEVQYFARLRRASDGAYRWHLCRSIAVRKRGGDIVMWCGNAMDVDNEVQASTVWPPQKKRKAVRKKQQLPALARV